MNLDEMNNEVLECARYGEHEDLKALIDAGANANYADSGGSTGLHKAAANGEVECIKVLHSCGAIYSKNSQGNTPAHWAAQNGKAEALKSIISLYEVDVLQKNDLGRSILTEAFASKCTDCIELCLSHDSASEERLINPNATAPAAADGTAPNGKSAEQPSEAMDTATSESVLDDANAVTHVMQFGEGNTLVKIRELPITRADNPFGTASAPEDDTTGIILCCNVLCLLIQLVYETLSSSLVFLDVCCYKYQF
jgi:ankyrin repeat protein